ncbi:APC family permease, partial [Francisella tularensis subsp. holarctica]|nr:APC family permease [Francisella tularensis subsp. holarctica]
GAGFLKFNDNLFALKQILTGLNIIGYMSATISMGAIEPNTRIFGMIVFLILTMLLNTVELETKIHLIIILVILISI